MRRKSRLIIPILCIAFMLLGGVATVSASGSSVDIPVVHKSAGDKKAKSETIYVTLKPKASTTEDGTVIAPLPEGTPGEIATLTIEGDGQDAFKNIKFGKDGVYKYEVSQKQGTRTIVNYDTSIFEVEVIVEDGKPHVIVRKKDDVDKDVIIEFEDEFEEGEMPPTAASPEVQKQINADKGKYQNDTFTFEMVPTDETADLLGSEKTYTAKVKGEGKVKFPEINIDEPGSYVFNITEKATNTGSWKYDAAKYVYTINVVKQDDELVVDDILIKKDGKDAQSVKFTNTPTTTNKIITEGKRIYSDIKTGDTLQWIVLLAMILTGAIIICVILTPKKRRNSR